MTYEEAESLALRAIHDEDGRGMVGSGRNHLHQRVARAILKSAAGVKLPPQPDEAREGSQSPDDGRAPGLTPDHIVDVTDMIPNSNTERRV